MEALLINLLILAIVAAVGFMIITLIPAGMPQNIAWCILAVILVIWLIRMLKSSPGVLSDAVILLAPIMSA